MAKTITISLYTQEDWDSNGMPLEERTFTGDREINGGYAAEAYLRDVANRLFVMDDDRYDGPGEPVGCRLIVDVRDDEEV